MLPRVEFRTAHGKLSLIFWAEEDGGWSDVLFFIEDVLTRADGGGHNFDWGSFIWLRNK